MKKIIGFVFLLILALASSAQTDQTSFTKTILRMFTTSQYDSLYALQDAEMKRQIDARDYQNMWEGFIEKYDTLVTFGETTTTTKDSLWIAETKIEFVKKSFLLRLSINKQNQLAGIFFANTKINHTPPDYVNTLLFYEVKIPVPVKGISSGGVLSLPKGNKKFPLVIITGGSGPTDKDGTSGPNKPYKDLAWALAAKGIAVYRYDKRTANPENLKGIKADKFTMEQEYLIDLKQLVKLLAADKRIDADNIFIAGHSQGGFMIPYFKTNLPRVKGYIGLAAPFRTIAEIIPEQITFLSSLQTDSASQLAYSKLITKALYTKNHVYDNKANKDSMFSGITPAFVQHMDKNKPDRTGSVLKKTPLLFIQGKRDYQVPATELELWKNKLSKACCAKYVVFDKLNHLLMEGEGVSTPSEYSKPNNVPEYVASEIATWINETINH